MNYHMVYMCWYCKYCTVKTHILLIKIQSVNINVYRQMEMNALLDEMIQIKYKTVNNVNQYMFLYEFDYCVC